MVFASSSARPSANSGGYFADLTLLVLGGSALLIAIVLWFDNAQGGLTGNGVFKSLELKPWVTDPANAPLYPSNYLYYPLYGALCRLLDLLGVFAGDPRRQITILNAVSGSLCLAVVYLLVRAVTGDRLIALLAAMFHLASSFVMFLAIVNEDILPSYTVLFAAMALASVWFARPTAARVAAVAVLFSLAWLMEWRLMFPTLPGSAGGAVALRGAAGAAAGLDRALPRRHARHGVRRRLGLAGPRGRRRPDRSHVDGQGRALGLGGLHLAQGRLSVGRHGGLPAGRGRRRHPGIPGWDIWRYTATIWMVAIAAVALPMLWRARHDPRARALGAIFGVTFVAGCVFNLYSQPQDPQMQINVMGWLTVAWALVLVAAAAALRRPRTGGAGRADGGAVRLQCLEPGAAARARQRLAAGDRAARARAPIPRAPSSLMHDFDWAMVYASLHWGSAEPGSDTLGPAPQARPEIQVDRLHRPGAAPSRLERRAAGRRPAAPDRSRAGAGLRRAGGAAMGHGPVAARDRDRHGRRAAPDWTRCAACCTTTT